MAIAGVRALKPTWWQRSLPDEPIACDAGVHFVEPKVGPAKLVAVCDDDLPFIRFVERVLRLEGAAVVPVTTLDREEAVRVIAESRCDSALIDLHMYNDASAGLNIVRMLRSQPETRNIRLRLATGAPRDLRGESQTLKEMRVGLLPKPFTVEELLASLGLPTKAFRAA